MEPVELDFIYGGNTATEGKKIEQSLENIANKSKATQTAVNNVGKGATGFNSMNMSVQQVVRELPAATMGLNMFFLAISNNLPIMSDNIKRARMENEALKASGASTTPVWKQLLSSLVSWQTAMMVGITIISMYGKEIINAFSKGGEAAQRAKEDVKKFNDAFSTSAAEPLAKVNQLADRWNKLGSNLEEKKKFVDDNKTAFRELGVEINNVNDAENLLVGNVDAFRRAMIAKAMSVAAMQVATEKYKEYFNQMRDAEKMNETVNVATGSGGQSVTGGGSMKITTVKNSAKIRAKKMANALKAEGDSLILESNKQNEAYDAFLEKAGIKRYEKQTKTREKAQNEAYNSERDFLSLIYDLEQKSGNMLLSLQEDSLKKRLEQVEREKQSELKAIEDKQIAIIEAYNKSNKDKKGFTPLSVKPEDIGASLTAIDPKLAKQLATQTEGVEKVFREKTKSEIRKWNDELKELALSFADEREQIESNYNEKIKKLRDGGQEDAAKLAEQERDKKISIASRGLIEESELYKVAADDKLQISEEMTSRLIDDIQRRVDAEVAAGKMSVSDANKIMAEVKKARNLLNTDGQNPFANLRNAISNNTTAGNAYKQALSDPTKTTAELAKLESEAKKAATSVAATAGAALQGVQAILQETVGALDQLGLLTEEEKKDADNIIGMVGGAANIAMGIATGNPLAIIQGAVDLLVNAIEFFDFKNKALEKSQRQHMKNVEELEAKYKKLQRAVETALGTDIYKAQREQIENQKKQIAEYEAWLADEAKKKKRKQDEAKIADTKAKIDELKNSIEDQVQAITESLAQTSVKDLASQLSDALVGAFQSGESAAVAMGDVVNNVLRNAVINALKLKVLDKLLAPAIDQFAVDVESGGELTGSEADKFRNTVTAAGEAYLKALNEANTALGGIFTQSSTATGIKGDVANMTEQTGSALVGQITAMRLNIVAMLANSRSSLDSVSRALATLDAIKTNTDRLNRIDETLYYIKLNGVKVL